MLCNPSCGTRRKTSLERRFSADRCAVIASLYLPQAALGDNARHSPSASCSILHIQKTASTAKAILAVLSVGYKKDIFAVFAYEFELSQILNL